jgi:phosphatidylglycerol:prolipoprotein diacylglycerol transferase
VLPEITLGPISVSTFALSGIAGFWAAGWVMSRRLVELRRPGEWGWEMVLCGMFGGILGASIDWAIQNQAPITQALGGTLTGGGLVWFGGALGGIIVVGLWAWLRGFLGWEMYSVAALALVVVQFFGRLGCQLAGDGDYGIPWNGPWAMSYANGVVPTPPGVTVHPTPIYEMIGLGLLFAVLWRYRNRWPAIISCAVWLIGVALIRFPVEFIRRNPEVWLGLTTAQLVSLAAGALGLVLLALVAWRGKDKSPPAEPLGGS